MTTTVDEIPRDENDCCKSCGASRGQLHQPECTGFLNRVKEMAGKTEVVEPKTYLVIETHDPVNKPKHYTNHPSGIECIQITRHMGFNLGNAMKYIWRADLKNGVEDLEKAIWYIKDEIEKRKLK